MNLVLISCLLLFIIYFSIIGLLVYYFFRGRDTWNIFFNEIFQDFQSIVSGCPRHNIFNPLIPGLLYSYSNVVDGSSGGSSGGSGSGSGSDNNLCGCCGECAREDKTRESNLYNVKILKNIYELLATLEIDMLEDEDITSRCQMFQLLLEYIIRNYCELCNSDLALYERLQLVYLDKNKGNGNDESSRVNKSFKGIEIIPFLEEYSSIIEKLYSICNEINIESVEGTFMIAFYHNFKIFITDSRNYLSEFLGLKS
jgi:hypothetical protein